MFKHAICCSNCGTKLPPPITDETIEDRGRECPRCKILTYDNAKLVAILIQPVVNPEGREGIVLIRRAIPPAVGQLAFPGGYVEIEDWRLAAAREARQEAQLLVPNWEQIRIFDSRSVVGGSITLNFGLIHPIPEAELPPFVPGKEVSERVVVYEATKLAFDAHTEVLSDYFASRRTRQ